MMACTTLLVIFIATSGLSVAMAESHSVIRFVISLAPLRPGLGCGYVRRTRFLILHSQRESTGMTHRIETSPSNSGSRNHPDRSPTPQRCRVIMSNRSLGRPSSRTSESLLPPLLELSKLSRPSESESESEPDPDAMDPVDSDSDSSQDAREAFSPPSSSSTSTSSMMTLWAKVSVARRGT